MSVALGSAPERDATSAELHEHQGRGGRPAPAAVPGAGPIEIAAFAALAAFTAVHWSALVADPPLGGTLLAVALATAGGVAASRIRPSARSPMPRSARSRLLPATLRSALLLLGAGAALVAIGLPAALLAPWGWPELADGLGRGLAGLRTLGWPYDGPDPWVALVVLGAVPLVVTTAAGLAFWPLDRGRELFRGYALVTLVALYGVAVAQVDPGAPLVRGAILLVLLAGWLVLPGMRRGGARAAAATLAVAAAVSLPLAAGLPSEPALDYRSWTPFGTVAGFDWDHEYGPIDWPRTGATVLEVESARPHYWRTATLEYFDGVRWSGTGADPDAASEPPRGAPERWIARSTFTVGALDSALLASPGAVLDVEGVEAEVGPDGTAAADEAPEQGDSYTVRAYAPDPSPSRMRAAPDPPTSAASPYTAVELPVGADLTAGGPRATALVSFPGRGEALGGTPGAEGLALASPYAGLYRRARRIAAPAATTYDAVRLTAEHLRARYRYDEQPPPREWPLAAFLLEDRAGYCQQFSGAMALMLRMNGIPARVAAGFAPGSRLAADDPFTVSDLDGHSWVEVHFRGIGWVPFDPTPSAAPADSRADGTLASAARGDDGRPAPAALGGLAADPGSAGGAGAERAGPGAILEAPAGPPPATGLSGWWPAAAALAVLALGSLTFLGRRRRGAAGPDATVAELRAALERLGHPVHPGATLAEVERRLEASGHRPLARHVRRLRDHRYAAIQEPGPDRGDLRRAITAGAGPLARLRGVAGLPPGRRGRGRFTAY